MKKIILLLTAVSLLLCGCGAPAETETTAATTAAATEPAENLMLGTWYAHIDCTDLCNSQMQALLGEELTPYFTFPGMNVLLQLDLNAGGDFSATITQETISSFADAITQITQDNLRSYLEQTMAEELKGESLDAYMVRKQLTMDMLLVAAGIDLPLLISNMVEPLKAIPCTGTYYIHDQLHIAGAVCDYTVSDSTLSLEKAEGENLAAFPALLPLEFFRQETPPLGFISEDLTPQ